jgi:hypothetical protein
MFQKTITVHPTTFHIGYAGFIVSSSSNRSRIFYFGCSAETNECVGFSPMPGPVSNADRSNPIVTNHAVVEGIVPGRASEVVGGQHDHQHHVDVDGNKINELKRQIRVLKQVGYVSIMILLFINYHTYMLSIIEQEEQDY